MRIRILSFCTIILLLGSLPCLAQVDSTQIKGLSGQKDPIIKDSNDIIIRPDLGLQGRKPTDSSLVETLPIETFPVPDSLTWANRDTLSHKEKRQQKRASRPPINPNQAVLRSLLLPGLGQIYNRRYWKLPIIYGALGGIGYGIGFYHNEYKIYQSAYICRNDTTCLDSFPGLSDGNIKSFRDDGRRIRDLFIIFGVAVYALQILDAYVDAHLMEFDVSDDLSMRIFPDVMFGRRTGVFLGLNVNFRLK